MYGNGIKFKTLEQYYNANVWPRVVIWRWASTFKTYIYRKAHAISDSKID